MKSSKNKIKYFSFGIFAIFIFFSFAKNTFAITTSNTFPTNGLIGYWSFDEGSSTKAYDYSGKKYNGSLVNSPVWISGKVGGALQFNGTSNYIDAGNPALINSIATGDFSVSYWEKSTDTTSSGGVLGDGTNNFGIAGFNISKRHAGYNGVYFRIASSNGGMDIVPSSDKTSALYNGSWHHVIFVISRSTNTANIYLDNTVIGTVNISSVTGSIANSRNLYIGGGVQDSGLPTVFFPGSLDEVRVYNRALSATEVTQIYNAKSTKLNSSAPVSAKNSTGLVGYWTFDGADVSSTKAFDKSGSGFDLTRTNVVPTIGKIGQGMNFSQSNSRMSSATFSSPNTNSITIATWIKLSTTTPTQIVADGGGDLNFRLSIYNNGKIHQMVGNGTNWYPGAGMDSVTTLVANKWYHYAYVYDITNQLLKLYVNGVLENSVSVNITRSATAGIHVGNYSGGDNSAFKGAVDDFRVYSRALSSTEITKLAGAGTSKELKYDASSTAYFTASGLTNVTGRAQVDEFIKGLKSLGVWNNLSEVWLMRKNQNAPTGSTLYGLKNAYNGTYTGSTTMTIDGLVMADGNAGVNYSPNATVTFSAGGPSVMGIWSGLGNAVPNYSTIYDALTFLKSSGSQLYFSVSNGVGGGVSWIEQDQDIKGSRWYYNGGSVGVSGNHMAAWNGDTMHIFRDGVSNTPGSQISATRTDGSFTLQTRGRISAVPARQSMLLFMPPGINLTDTQMNQIYKLYRNTAGYGLNLP